MLRLLLLCLFCLSTPLLTAQKKNRKAEKDSEQTQTAAQKDEPKKDDKDTYRKLIEDAEVAEGLFTVIQKDGNVYFQIPRDLLEAEILVVSRISGHVKGLNFGGAGMKSRPQQVIRWQKKGKKILLRSVSYNSVADLEDPIYESVRNNNFEPIIAAFDLKAENPDSNAYVADVTSLFTTDVPMIGALSDSQRKRFGVKNLDKNRSLVMGVKAFPKNVEVRHVLTYNGTKLPDNAITGTLSVEMNQSFIELPEEPMQPRVYDPRVGYFSIRQINYSTDTQRAEARRLITRWRLEPVDMEAWERGDTVDVKKPIVYYLDPATPEQWAPYIAQGVDDWAKVFESIGLKNAIRSERAPTKEEDPDWSPEDVRYSVIRYVTTDIQNAQGPHVHDPRTGEILESDIIWYHNVMRLLRNWYLVQTAAVNPEARTPKFKREVMGELIRFVSAHEVGHTLGLPHNMGASAAYTVAQLRSPGFVQENGTAPSIMDYARFNYVAQPEDEGAGLHPAIGPYDYHSIEYGYKPIPEAGSMEAEKPFLNAMVKAKADDPRYRYGAQRSNGFDPSAQTEDLTDDAVEASRLGIRNLQRIVPNLTEWMAEDGEYFDDLEEVYDNVIGQLQRYAGHVANNVGGVTEWQRTSEEGKPVYRVVSAEKQRQAVEFLNREIFITPSWLLDLRILNRISPDGAAKKIDRLRQRTLNTLFNTTRLNRLAEQKATSKAYYGPLELMADTRKAVFDRSNLESSFGRNLQAQYVDRLLEIHEGNEVSADVKAAIRANLNVISFDLNRLYLLLPLRAEGEQAIIRAHERELCQRIDIALEGLAALREDD